MIAESLIQHDHPQNVTDKRGATVSRVPFRRVAGKYELELKYNL